MGAGRKNLVMAVSVTAYILCMYIIHVVVVVGQYNEWVMVDNNRITNR